MFIAERESKGMRNLQSSDRRVVLEQPSGKRLHLPVPGNIPVR